MGSKLRERSCKCARVLISRYPDYSRHIFLELATGGDLFSYMVKNGALCEGEVKYIAFQLMKGLQVGDLSSSSINTSLIPF
jgi:serine/threonine protein kinase